MKSVPVTELVAEAELARIATEGKIGIIAGSGPDAGIDLWRKLLGLRRARLGSNYRGDIDAPGVEIHSVPSLGLSMDMGSHATILEPVVMEAGKLLASQCKGYTIACNTLHFFANHLNAIPGGSFVSVQQVVRSELKSRGKKKFALLGASPVMSLGKWSPYRELQDEFDIETADCTALDELIYAVKVEGGNTSEIASEFKRIVDTLSCELVVIGCTELPLIAQLHTKHTFLDVTSLLAEALLATAESDST